MVGLPGLVLSLLLHLVWLDDDACWTIDYKLEVETCREFHRLQIRCVRSVGWKCWGYEVQEKKWLYRSSGILPFHPVHVSVVVLIVVWCRLQ